MPGHGSGGSTGASVPKGRSVPARSRSARGNAKADRVPQARCTAGSVREQVARLHRRGHAEGREARHVRRVHQLGVLEAVPGAAELRDPRQHVERGPHRAVADGMDLAGDACLGRPAGERSQLRGVEERHAPRATRRGAGRVIRLVGLQQRRRPAAQGAVREELEPAVVVATRERIPTGPHPGRPPGGRLGPRWQRPTPGPEAQLDGPLQLLRSHAGLDTQWQPAGRRQGAVERRPAAERRIRRDAPRVMHRRDAESRQLAGIGGDGGLHRPVVGHGDVGIDQAGRLLVEDARRTPRVVALDAPSGRVIPVGEAGHVDGRPADPARVVIVGPAGDRATGSRGIQEGRRWPAPERIEGPAVAQQPAVAIAPLEEAPMGPRDGCRHARQVQARQVRLLGREGREGQVQVGVGDGGRDHEVRGEGPLRRCRGQRAPPPRRSGPRP